MSAKYSLVQRGDPRDPSAPKKYYAQAKTTGEANLKTLSRQIEEITALSGPDILAAVSALLKVSMHQFEEGKMVRFDGFGSFKVEFSSEGFEKAEKFNPNTIKNVKIVFRPAEDLRNMLSTLKFSAE